MKRHKGTQPSKLSMAKRADVEVEDSLEEIQLEYETEDGILREEKKREGLETTDGARRANLQKERQRVVQI